MAAIKKLATSVTPLASNAGNSDCQEKVLDWQYGANAILTVNPGE